jgi:hypothetical protein
MAENTAFLSCRRLCLHKRQASLVRHQRRQRKFCRVYKTWLVSLSYFESFEMSFKQARGLLQKTRLFSDISISIPNSEVPLFC